MCDRNRPSKLRWAAISSLVLVALAAGIAIGLTPPATGQRIITLAVACILPLAALRTLFEAIGHFRARRRLLGALTAILTLLLGLLSLAAWDQFSRLG